MALYNFMKIKYLTEYFIRWIQIVEQKIAT